MSAEMALWRFERGDATERSVREMCVVVGHVLLQHNGEVARPGDQDVVDAIRVAVCR
jgi:hypothetical protein